MTVLYDVGHYSLVWGPHTYHSHEALTEMSQGREGFSDR